MGVLRISLSFVSSLLGLSCFIAFIILKNYAAAVLGLISGFGDATLLFIHILEYKKRLLVWYERTDLRKFCRLGIVIGSIGILSLGYFATVQIMLNKPMLPIPESGVIPIVWSFVVIRSACFLVYYSILYQETTDDTRLIVETTENN